MAAIASAAAITMPPTARPITRHDPIRSASEPSTIRPTDIATQYPDAKPPAITGLTPTAS